jgi:hypothetical protein
MSVKTPPNLSLALVLEWVISFSPESGRDDFKQFEKLSLFESRL